MADGTILDRLPEFHAHLHRLTRLPRRAARVVREDQPVPQPLAVELAAVFHQRSQQVFVEARPQVRGPPHRSSTPIPTAPPVET